MKRTPDRFRTSDRLRAALARTPQAGVTVDDQFSGIDPASLVPAAVLIAVTDRPDPGVLLTRRTSHLRNHAGQVAFPGGRIDLGDPDPIAAALREANEEIGLDPSFAEPITMLAPYRTGTGFHVTPVVASVPPDMVLVPHEHEVESIFEVPLGFLLDPANRLRREIEHEGAIRHYYEIMWNDYRIWGITAGMIVHLSHRLKAWS